MLATSSADSHQTHTNVQEISAILALGLQRLLERKSSHLSQYQEENQLDCGEAIHSHVQQAGKDLSP
jgi:hypothetical protein